MKKTFALIVSVVLIMSFAVNAVATGSQSIILGNAKFTEKDEVQTISVEAENLDALSIIYLILSYDSTKVELLNIAADEPGYEPRQIKDAAGSLISDAIVSCPEEGTIILVWESTIPVSGSGTLANLSFKALEDDIGTVKLSLSVYGDEESLVCRDDDNKFPKIVEIDFVEAPSGVTVSGEATSYIDGEKTVTISLYEGENAEPSYETTFTGNKTEYSISEVAEGTYTMKVSKANHVTREYEIVVGEENIEKDVKICPIGDINGDGKIAMVDYLRARQHAQSVQTLTGYEFACADINGDGRIVMVDYMRIRQHAQNVSKLW